MAAPKTKYLNPGIKYCVPGIRDCWTTLCWTDAYVISDDLFKSEIAILPLVVRNDDIDKKKGTRNEYVSPFFTHYLL